MVAKLLGSILFVSVLLVGFLALPLITERISANTEYFFFGDTEFVTPLSQGRWKTTIWNFQSDSYVKLENGIVELQYCEYTGNYWGASILFQGKYPKGGIGHLPLLSGRNEKEVKETDGITFLRNYPIPKGKYWLETRFIVLNRTFLHEVAFDKAKYNVGIDLMFAVNDFDYEDLTAPVVHAGLIFSGEIWQDGLGWIKVEIGDEWVFKDEEQRFHVSMFVFKISNVNEWQVCRVDFGEYLNRIFVLLQRENVNKLTLKGVQVYAESIGAKIQAKIDYIRTVVK